MEQITGGQFQGTLHRRDQKGVFFHFRNPRLQDVLLPGNALFGIRCKTYRHHRTGNDSPGNDPKRRFFVVQHVFHPLFYADFAKGQGADCHRTPPGTALQQGHGVLLFSGQIDLPDHLLVTGHLNVPAKQHIGNPTQGIEPVDRQNQKAQGFPPVVTPCQMCLFVGNHRLHGHRVHVGGQIDFGPDQSQDKRRLYLVTQ